MVNQTNNCPLPFIPIEDFMKTYTKTLCTEFKFKFGGGFVINGSPIYITKVIYNNPATIVFWSDSTKTVSKCSLYDIYSGEMGLVLCVLKKIVGSKEVHELISDWYRPGYETVTLADVRQKHKE